MKEKICMQLLKICSKTVSVLKRSKKWDIAKELYQALCDYNESVYCGALEKVESKWDILCYAPHIGFDIYICRYKGTLFAIQNDADEVSFVSIVTYRDYIVAQATEVLNRIGKSLVTVNRRGYSR